MLFEMPAGLDPLPIPPNDDILLPDDDLPPPPVQKPKAKRKRKEIKFLTEDELARLFSVIHSVRDAPSSSSPTGPACVRPKSDYSNCAIMIPKLIGFLSTGSRVRIPAITI